MSSLSLIYVGIDPGVDDAAALFTLIAARTQHPQQYIIKGIITNAGNVILTQANHNTLTLLSIAQISDIPVYSGARAPMAIESDEKAIQEWEKTINQSHFYGLDGLADIHKHPSITINLQPNNGIDFIVDQINKATPQNPIILFSTSPLTTLAKALKQSEKNNPNFAGNIKSLIIMGGIIDKRHGANAPFNLPSQLQNAEANFYMDIDATKSVFAIAKQHHIPLFIAPLDLTHQADLLWTSKQTAFISKNSNPMTNYFSQLASKPPIEYQNTFPKGSYPMHDLIAAGYVIAPHLYSIKKIAATIGNQGEIIIIPNSLPQDKFVNVLSMTTDNQKKFYQLILQDWNKFPKHKNNYLYITELAIAILIGMIAGICCYRFFHRN